MSAKPSKQLGSLLSRVPAATATGQGSASPRSVPYAAPDEPAKATRQAVPPAADDEEVPLQVLIPKHVRSQLNRKRAEEDKSIRRVVLEALRAIGLDVSETDIAGKRGRKKS